MVTVVICNFTGRFFFLITSFDDYLRNITHVNKEDCSTYCVDSDAIVHSEGGIEIAKLNFLKKVKDKERRKVTTDRKAKSN